MHARDRSKRTRLRDESGVAMIFALGAIVLITIVALGAYSLASQSYFTAGHTRDQAQAFQIANAGIDAALADVDSNGYKPAHYPVTKSLNGGSYTASVTALGGCNFLAQAVGKYSRGNARIRQKFFWLSIYDMNVTGATGVSLSGAAFQGQMCFDGPFYAKGNLTLDASQFTGGPLYVKAYGGQPGNLACINGGKAGTPTQPIDLYVSGTIPSSNCYYSHLSHDVPDLQLTPLDDTYMQAAWSSARAESIDNIQGSPSKSSIVNLEANVAHLASSYTTINPPNSGWTRSRPNVAGSGSNSSYYKVIAASDAGISPIYTGTHTLTLASTSFGSWSGDGHYPILSHDDFAYNGSTGDLYVEGTVFVDGGLVVNKTIQYHGNGRIVCNSDISLHYKFRPWSNNGHLSNADCVGLVTPGNIMLEVSDNSGAPMPGDPPSWAGAFYCMRQLSIPAQGTLMEGTIIAGQMVASDPNSHLYTNPMLPGYLPDGMPGAGRALVSRGTWTRD